MLRIYIRKKVFPAETLIEVGKKTFLTNFGEEIPRGWAMIVYPMEAEIDRYKDGMKTTFCKVHGLSIGEAEEIICKLSQFF